MRVPTSENGYTHTHIYREREGDTRTHTHYISNDISKDSSKISIELHLSCRINQLLKAILSFYHLIIF